MTMKGHLGPPASVVPMATHTQTDPLPDLAGGRRLLFYAARPLFSPRHTVCDVWAGTKRRAHSKHSPCPGFVIFPPLHESRLSMGVYV